MSQTILSTELRREQDVVAVRNRARQIAVLLGFEPQDQTRIATAVSEIGRNAINYARGGRVEYGVALDERPQLLEIRIHDSGPGIANLDSVLDGEYRSGTGMGLGILGARRLMDSFGIDTSPEGTTVRMGKRLPARSKPVTMKRLGEISTQLARQTSDDPYDELRHQNRELMESFVELRQRTDELVETNSELEATNRGVVALYAELDEKADELRRADGAKTRFLSHVTHEFRTPVSSILALASMLLNRMDGDLTPEQERQVLFIKSAADTLGELLNDLLDLAKVEAGKVDIRPNEFTVEEMFSTLRGMLKPLHSKPSVELVFQEGTWPNLFTDQGKVAQILRNFLSNALKFTEAGEVRLSVRAEQDGHMTFSVADTGIGIAPEDVERVFEEFVQLPGPLQERYKGTGLGLSLSRKLAELLGGSVAVSSILGKGSIFSLTIPARLEKGGPAHVPGTVLLVDDDVGSRYILRQQLRDLPFEMVEAASGPEALEKAREIKPGLIVLDLVMPGMSGFEVLRRLKMASSTAGIPVIVSSSKLLSAEEAAELQDAHMVLVKNSGDAHRIREFLLQHG